MKIIILILVSLAGFSSFAQSPQDEAEARQVVIDFFEAFHRQDTIVLRNLSHPSAVMQSLAENSGENNKLSTITYADFLQRIKSIPSTTKFEEKLHSYDVRVNGALATVITPYTFHLNGNISHCGVNSFTMVKEAEEWKITHIIDTRNKIGCE